MQDLKLTEKQIGSQQALDVLLEDIQKQTDLLSSGIDTMNWLGQDKWFKQNPTKILGQTYFATDKFGKEISKVKGSIENVTLGIDVPSVELPMPTADPLISKGEFSIQEDQATPFVLENLNQVILEAKQQHAQDVLRAELTHEPKTLEENNYYQFEEILEQYNEGISEQEIKAWVWYKQNSDGYNDDSIILKENNGWSKFVISPTEQENQLKNWLSEGIICYQNDQYIPSVLYYAENIYRRQSELLSSKEELIEKHGIDQYERQWNGLENVKPLKLRLSDEDVEKRLIINPKSSFVKETRISKLTDGTLFREYNQSSGKYEDSPRGLLKVFADWLYQIPASVFKKSSGYHIIEYFLKNRNLPRRYDKDERQRIQRNAKLEGEQLFSKFLAEGISKEDQQNIENSWNAKYNGYVEINYLKIPIAFTCSKTFKNKPLKLRTAQREGIGFISVHGSGCIAYDVGVGKTMTAILSLAQAMESGQCKRPLIVVPNQTYENWLSELRGKIEDGNVVLTGILPQYQIIGLYNLGKDYLSEITAEDGEIKALPESSITVMTYQGFNRLGFNEQTWDEIGKEFFQILNQGRESAREREKLYEKIEELMGQGIKGGLVNIEDLGFDYIVIDEAHAMKKSFTQVRGEVNNKGARERSSYKISSGQPSMIALRGFMVAQYILRSNKMRNVLLLTATPFTNSPLEIYSILALIGFQELEKSGIKNIKEFFDNFIKTSVELTINAKLQPERKELVLGFNNLIALQQLIFRFINYKTGEDANITRPNKIVLPLTSQSAGHGALKLPTPEQISTNLPMTAQQKEMMEQIEAYVRGQIDLMEFCVNHNGFEDQGEQESGDHIEDMSIDEQDNARVLRALSFASQLALSPYLYACNPAGEPTAKEFIESSPKLNYTVLCIQSVKAYAEKHRLEMPGQVIYCNAGVRYFPLIKEYLVEYIGFAKKEVGMIKSGMSAARKDGIKDKFLSGEVKVLIGSATIKEGINLQYRATDLYDLWLDWNPTDVKQLEGRIWRPGNRYANVRITFPLLENSIDIFKFQKLQEKTSRINEIWHRSNRANALKLEKFNPAELKRGLITDPYALAELYILEEKEVLQDEINSLANQKEVLLAIHKARGTVEGNLDRIKEVVEKYKPKKEGQVARKIETLFKIYKEWLDDPTTNTFFNDERVLTQTRKAHYHIQSGIRDVLAPRGLDIHFDYDQVIGKLEKEMEDKNIELQDRTGQEAINRKAAEIANQRRKEKYQSKSVTERVKAFASLNEKVLGEFVLQDIHEDQKKKDQQRSLQADDLLLTADILEDVSQLEALMTALKQLEIMQAELDHLLAA